MISASLIAANSRVFNKDYWYEDTDPYAMVHEVSMPLYCNKTMGTLFDVGFRPHTKFTFEVMITHEATHPEHDLQAFEACSKGVTLPGDREKSLHVLSRLSTRRHKMTMAITEITTEIGTGEEILEWSVLSFQDWVKGLRKMVC